MRLITLEWTRTARGSNGERYSKSLIIASALATLAFVLILLLLGALPSWPYSSGWGYGPSGLIGLVLVVVIILALTGRL